MPLSFAIADLASEIHDYRAVREGRARVVGDESHGPDDRGRWYTRRVADPALVIEELERRGWLPAIYFIFSRVYFSASTLFSRRSPLPPPTALVADDEDGGNRTREVLDVARELGCVRDADTETGTTARLLEGLDAIRVASGGGLAPADLLKALRERPGWEWVKNTRRLAGLLNPLGIVRQQVREGDRRRWCYFLQADQLADLQARYGSAAEAGDEPDRANDARVHLFGSDPVTTGASGDNPHE